MDRRNRDRRIVTEGPGKERTGTETTWIEGTGTEGIVTEGTGKEEQGQKLKTTWLAGIESEGIVTEGTGKERTGTEATWVEGTGTVGIGREVTETKERGMERTGTAATRPKLQNYSRRNRNTEDDRWHETWDRDRRTETKRTDKFRAGAHLLGIERKLILASPQMTIKPYYW
jgi:hypothetical protein